jgi:hypothetical protein
MQRIVLNILWASFLAAVAAEGFCLLWVDAAVMLRLVSPRDRMAAYGLGFLCFWLVGALAAALAQVLNMPLWRGPRNAAGTVPNPSGNSRFRPPAP